MSVEAPTRQPSADPDSGTSEISRSSRVSLDIRLSSIEVRLPPDDRLLFRISDYRVPAGTRVLIGGASGLGKTTLIHLIAGLFLPRSGEVHLGAHRLNTLTDEARCCLRRKHVGIVFQKLNLLDHLTACENVLLALPSARSSVAIALAALDRLGLKNLAHARSAALSLGEQQRVAVARVVAARPDIILADEPTSSLDQANADAVMQALFDVSVDRTLVVVSHDQRIRGRFAGAVDFAEVIAP